MAGEKILVVEDDANIQELIHYNLSREGFKVVPAGSGEEALKEVSSTLPDLFILDLMLPGMDGLEVCRRLKGEPKTCDIPVVILTAKSGEADIVAGLELGADDYMTKPFSPRVLTARVRAVLRRKAKAASAADAVIKIRDLVIHPGRYEVTAGGEIVGLTSLEFRYLHTLARRPGWVFTRYQLVYAVHGEGYPVTDRSVDAVIVGLRRKLGEYGKYLETVRGVGYRFRE
ncbi:MAG: response regulator transcription factor [Candidatus Glassbacteria bacterium]|nr:response regulator transcription factor [Candidatus Glassbacteria bacterium]